MVVIAVTLQSSAIILIVIIVMAMIVVGIVMAMVGVLMTMVGVVMAMVGVMMAMTVVGTVMIMTNCSFVTMAMIAKMRMNTKVGRLTKIRTINTTIVATGCLLVSPPAVME